MLVCIGISFSSFFQKILKKVSIFFLGSYLWLAAELQKHQKLKSWDGYTSENRQEKTFWEKEVLIKCKTWFFQKSQNLHFLNASFRVRFDRCFIVIVTSETCTLSFLKFDRCFIVVSSFITPRDQSSSLVHRWENFWLFKLLLLMDASAYYVKHRCNTTKHPQEFFLFWQTNFS